MQLRVSAPGNKLTADDREQIRIDLEKLDRRLARFKEPYVECRINGNGGSVGYEVTLELEAGRLHLISKSSNRDRGQAVRAAREEMIRQINDARQRRRGSHSQYAKGT